MSASDWKYLKVSGLFHKFDYRLDFPSPADPLILTGPNGYGKTTLLTMLDALAHEDYLYFWDLPFGSLELGYGKYQISIRKEFRPSDDEEGRDDNLSDDRRVVFSYSLTDSKDAEFIALDLDRQLISSIEAGLKGSARGSEFDEERKNKVNDFLRHSPQTEPFRILLRQFKVVFLPAERLRHLTFNGPEKEDADSMLRTLRLAFTRLERSAARNNSLNDLLGISDDSTEPHAEETILRLSRRLKRDMTAARQSYNSLVTSNNHALIERMLSEDQEIDAETYNAKAAELTKRIDLLLKFGLINADPLPEYSPGKASRLRAYIEAMEENLRSYDGITLQLQTFLDWLDRNEFVGKAISASPLEGLVATENRHNSHIPLGRLSSGEKHEIILAYWLAFEVADGALLLIDEPELSLHVGWQIKFIPALRRIAERKNLVCVVATHAPCIINEEWDKTVDLELLDREKDNANL